MVPGTETEPYLTEPISMPTICVCQDRLIYLRISYSAGTKLIPVLLYSGSKLILIYHMLGFKPWFSIRFRLPLSQSRNDFLHYFILLYVQQDRKMTLMGQKKWAKVKNCLRAQESMSLFINDIDFGEKESFTNFQSLGFVCYYISRGSILSFVEAWIQVRGSTCKYQNLLLLSLYLICRY
ncbi:hypothetical protein Hanom_Chr14g01307751 [Helianthus anomalus]